MPVYFFYTPYYENHEKGSILRKYVTYIMCIHVLFLTQYLQKKSKYYEGSELRILEVPVVLKNIYDKNKQL